MSAYKFSNLLGAVYAAGNVAYSPDGNWLYSPIGCSLSVFDLVNNQSWTLYSGHLSNIDVVAVHPQGSLILTIDDSGRSILSHVHKRRELSRFRFKSRVTTAQFSPCGRFIAVALEHKNMIQIWRTPFHGLTSSSAIAGVDSKVDSVRREFCPFVLHRSLMGHHDRVNSINWSLDGLWLVSSSKDLTCRVFPRDFTPSFRMRVLAAHREKLVGAWFHEGTNDTVISLAQDGACFVWQKIEEEPRKDASGESDGDESSISDHESLIDPDVQSNENDSDSQSVSSSQSDDQSNDSDSDSQSDDESAPSGDNDENSSVSAAGERPSFRYHAAAKHFFDQKGPHGLARVKSAAFHRESSLLVVGFSTGVFSLYEMPDCNQIHSLSISQNKIDSLAISPAGDWLAFACAGSAQLLVWEWQSETYILKQQGHRHNLSHIAYSPDGQAIATGSDDGKLKLWNTQSGFCYVTFTDHSAGITACEFIGKQGGKQGVVFTASLDGTVRAFDLIRYRCFRTFTAPHPCQFVSLAIDASGELVCAGSMDTYEIFIWSVQTGQLLDVLAGHEGPVTSLAFSPEGTVAASSATSATLLISGSWDKTVRVWDVYSRGNGSKCMETFRHQHDVMAVAFRPDGKEIAAATLDGLISFWDPYEGTHAARISEIEGRRDIAGGRKATDRRSARNTSNDKYFTSLAYTADGNGLLAGGNSKWVCFYDLPSQVLLRKEQICKNLAFDGLQERLSSKRMTEAGPLDLMDVDEELSDVEDRVAARQYLPGVQKGDLSERKVRPEIRTKCLRFNPTGRSWAAATTEGLVIYSLDDTVVFDPFDLEMDLTPDAIRRMVLQAKTDTGQNDWLEALVMSLRLNEAGLIQYVYESIPPGSLELVAQGLPRLYLDRMLAIIAALFESSSKPTLESNASTLHRSPHLEFHLVFLSHLLRIHGRYLREHCRSRGSIHIQAGKGKSSNLVISSMPIILRAVKKSVTMLREDLSQVCDNNLHVLEFLRLSGHLKESIKMDE